MLCHSNCLQRIVLLMELLFLKSFNWLRFNKGQSSIDWKMRQNKALKREREREMQKVGVVMSGGRGVSKSVWLCQLLFEWSWLESDFWSGEIHLHTFSTRLRLRRCIFQEVQSTLATRVRARLSDVDLSDWSSCSRSIALTAVRVQEAMLWVYYIQFFFSTSTGIHAWQTSHRPIPIPNSLPTHHLVLLDCHAASLSQRMLSQDMSRSRCTVTVTFFGLMDLSNQASAVCLERPSHFHTLSKHKTRQTKK